jgi:ketosteroid isomerase-like protein
MKKSLLTSIIVAALAAFAFGSPAESELKTLEQQWLDAYVKGDAAFLKNIEAEDYSVVEPDGSVLSKAGDVKAVTDKTFVLKSASMSDIKVRMLGENFACVTGLLKLSGTDAGKDITGTYRGLDVFEKKDGKWQAVSSQVTKVQKE